MQTIVVLGLLLSWPEKPLHETMPGLAPDRWDRDRKQLVLEVRFDERGRMYLSDDGK